MQLSHSRNRIVEVAKPQSHGRSRSRTVAVAQSKRYNTVSPKMQLRKNFAITEDKLLCSPVCILTYINFMRLAARAR